MRLVIIFVVVAVDVVVVDGTVVVVVVVAVVPIPLDAVKVSAILKPDFATKFNGNASHGCQVEGGRSRLSFGCRRLTS
jgi:hypothetical protein